MFDILEARLNSAAMKKLSNATAIIAGKGIPVIFDAAYKVGSVGVVGMGASEPQMILSTADAPSEFVDSVISVNGSEWTVTDRQADSELPTGLTQVYLAKA